MEINTYFRGEVKNNKTNETMYVNLVNSTKKERHRFKSFYNSFIENGHKKYTVKIIN